MMGPLDLSGSVSLVTGSSRGIGWAIAKRLAGQGSNIVLNSRSNAERLAAREQEIVDTFGVECVGAIGDVSIAKDAQAAIKAAFSRFRQLDILVNNAGVLRDGLIGMNSLEDIDDTIDTNLKGVIHCTQAASRLLQRSSQPSIINISSIIGRFGNRGQMVYGASKAGVIGATLSAAKELGEMGIRVNAVAPGYIDTDMIADILPEIHQQRLDSIGMKVIGQPENVADVVLFLASSLSSYVTGQVIGVDGGMII